MLTCLAFNILLNKYSFVNGNSKEERGFIKGPYALFDNRYHVKLFGLLKHHGKFKTRFHVHDKDKNRIHAGVN